MLALLDDLARFVEANDHNRGAWNGFVSGAGGTVLFAWLCSAVTYNSGGASSTCDLPALVLLGVIAAVVYVTRSWGADDYAGFSRDFVVADRAWQLPGYLAGTLYHLAAAGLAPDSGWQLPRLAGPLLLVVFVDFRALRYRIK